MRIPAPSIYHIKREEGNQMYYRRKKAKGEKDHGF